MVVDRGNLHGAKEAADPASVASLAASPHRDSPYVRTVVEARDSLVSAYLSGLVEEVVH